MIWRWPQTRKSTLLENGYRIFILDSFISTLNQSTALEESEFFFNVVGAKYGRCIYSFKRHFSFRWLPKWIQSQGRSTTWRLSMIHIYFIIYSLERGILNTKVDLAKYRLMLTKTKCAWVGRIARWIKRCLVCPAMADSVTYTLVSIRFHCQCYGRIWNW